MPRISTISTLCFIGAISALISACAAPPALQIISFALDGISYITTDKTITDHGLSTIAGKDCKMLRTLQGADICKDEEAEPEMKLLDTMLSPIEDHAPAQP